MQKAGRLILAISLICNIILGFLLYKDSSPSIPNVSTEKIDSLGVEVTGLEKAKDSVKVRIDTIQILIRDNDLQYKKEVSTIINNTLDSDYSFFREYLRWNRARLDSINNTQ